MNMLALHPMVHGLLPELLLVGGASAILIVGVLGARALAFPLSILSAAGAIWLSTRLAILPADATAALHVDSLVAFTRVATLLIGVLILLVNRHVPEDSEQPEYFSLILFSLAGIMLVAVANDLVLLFLALELVSVPTYILIGLSRKDVRAQEATGKYFFLGAFAAALMLYGFSFLYGAAGTMQLFPVGGETRCLANVLIRPEALADKLTMVGLLFVIGGLAFKIAAVPMHFYVADVYQGAASPMTGMLGFVPKFAGFIALIRIFSMTGWAMSDAMFWLLWALAALTMTVGNTLALMQQNVKRTLAYSSVAHSGYMLVALLAGPGGLSPNAVDHESPLRNGLSALLFYMVMYGVMNLGAFAAFSCLRKTGDEGDDDSVERLEDVAGCARKHPWAALALAICLLSLMGMPPTGGFLGKLYLLSSAMSSEAGTARAMPMLALVIIGVLNSAIAAAYYLRIIAACYLGKPADGIHASRCRMLHVGLAACAVLVMALFLRPAMLFDRAHSAVADLGGKPASSQVTMQTGLKAK